MTVRPLSKTYIVVLEGAGCHSPRVAMISVRRELTENDVVLDLLLPVTEDG